MIYNFNTCPQNGKTYYEIEKSWRELKASIKRILDEPQKSRYEKILEIESRLEIYKNYYLKGSDKNE